MCGKKTFMAAAKSSKKGWFMLHKPLVFQFQSQLHYNTESHSVSFSSCQWNLIKTFQIEGMIALITKMDLIFSWHLLTAKNSRQKVPKSDFQSQFSTSKIIQIFLKNFFVNNINFVWGKNQGNFCNQCNHAFSLKCFY